MSNIHIPSLLDNFKVDFALNDIQKSSEGALIATVDATHAGFINKNFYYYVPDRMRASVDSWVSPFNKPFIKYHDKNSSDPMGRVVAARYIGDDNKGFIQLDINVPDHDAALKIQDRRYLTVSTSADPVEYVKCSICGQNHLSSRQFCGHKRGGRYFNEDTEVTETCFWYVGKLRYKEVSQVNVPADQSEEHAAVITGWKFQDAEGSVPINTDAFEMHKGVLIMKSNLWIPKSVSDIEKVAQLIAGGADIVANKSLFESLDHEDPAKVIEAYVTKGGQFQGDYLKEEPTGSTDAAPALNTDDQELVTRIKDSVLEISDEYTEYLTDRAADDKKGKMHRHVIYVNEAGNGWTDYVLGHGHEVVDNVIQNARKRVVDEEGNVSYQETGHTHTKEDKALGVSDTDYFDPQAALEDSAKDSTNPFADFDTNQILQAFNLLAQFSDKSEPVEKLIKERAKELGCSFPDQISETADLLNTIIELS